MLIAEFCRRSGLTKDAVRHYESLGLLKPASVTAGSRQYRRFNESDIERVYFIKLGAQAGIRLREMNPLLDDLIEGRFSYDEQRQIVRDQLVRLDQKIARLLHAKRLLRDQFKRIDERAGVC